MSYVDGFVAAVPAANRDAYVAHARTMGAILLENGAIRVVETWADDVPDGKVTDFRRAVAAETGEEVVFAWIEWPSKAARDAGWAAMMADPRMQPDVNPMPFDGRRMIHGGFGTLMDLAR